MINICCDLFLIGVGYPYWACCLYNLYGILDLQYINLRASSVSLGLSVAFWFQGVFCDKQHINCPVCYFSCNANLIPRFWGLSYTFSIFTKKKISIFTFSLPFIISSRAWEKFCHKMVISKKIDIYKIYDISLNVLDLNYSGF